MYILFVVIFQGCGKSIFAKKFADTLGYNIETIMLYQVGLFILRLEKLWNVFTVKRVSKFPW